MPAAAQIRPFKRTGLHRLSCPACTGYAYSTVSQLETVGMPVCACGETFEPERLELALHLELDTPITRSYVAKCSSVAHGQAWTNRAGLAQPETRAYVAICSAQTTQARERRLAALKPAPELIPF